MLGVACGYLLSVISVRTFLTACSCFLGLHGTIFVRMSMYHNTHERTAFFFSCNERDHENRAVSRLSMSLALTVVLVAIHNSKATTKYGFSLRSNEVRLGCSEAKAGPSRVLLCAIPWRKCQSIRCTHVGCDCSLSSWTRT